MDFNLWVMSRSGYEECIEDEGMTQVPSPQLYGSDVEIEVIYKITFGDFIFVYCYCYCL